MRPFPGLAVKQHKPALPAFFRRVLGYKFIGKIKEKIAGFHLKTAKPLRCPY